MEHIFRSVYLHYLDRELAVAIDFKPTPAIITAATRTLLIATASDLNCGLSPAWESLDDAGYIASFLCKLREFHQLSLVSHHKTLGEFLASRQKAYKHDAKRYPMYFSKRIASLDPLSPTEIKPSSATSDLHSGLLQWVTTEQLSSALTREEHVGARKLKRDAKAALSDLGSKAVTFAAFRPFLKGLSENPSREGVLKRQISTLYTDHYIRNCSGEIPTGITGLNYFDSLTKAFPCYDLPLLSQINAISSANAIERNSRMWEQFLATRGGLHHRLYADLTRVLIAGADAQASAAHVGDGYRERREVMIQIVARLGREFSAATPPPADAESVLRSSSLALQNVIRRGHRNAHFAAAAKLMETEVNSTQMTILLVVATEAEQRAVLEAVYGSGASKAPMRFIGDHTYFNIGMQGGCEVVMVRSEMGSGGASGSLVTTLDAIEAVSPSYLIMVGIAFGSRKTGQKIGDVLVSKQLHAYELARVETDLFQGPRLRSRGDKVSASPKLLDRFNTGKLTWTRAGVHVGLLLSGEKLVDSSDFKADLLRREPDAIGGEMEGAGMLAAASKEKIDWIVVKAIADWGENKADKDQATASANAVDFVLHVIRQGGLAA